MARFGEEGGVGFFFVAPDSTDIAVGEVEVMNGLHVLNADDVADHAGPDDFLHLDKIGGIAQDMADTDDCVFLSCEGQDVRTFSPCLGDRFF